MSPIKETNFFAQKGKKVNFNGPKDNLVTHRRTITEIVDYNNQFINNYCGLILGVPENNDIDLKLYPNPATDYFYLSGEINNAELSIFNNILVFWLKSMLF